MRRDEDARAREGFFLAAFLLALFLIAMGFMVAGAEDGK
jgi:hypothetical protein